MAKTKKSSRSKKKKKGATTSTSKSASSGKSPPVRRRSGRNKPSGVQSPNSSNSQTSPFKGYDETSSRHKNVERPRVSEGLIRGEAKTAADENKDPFDRLLDENYKSNFHSNMKTYTNRRKTANRVELLEFQDCKNRDEVVRWLNDNRNVFDRLTQTQTHTQCDDSELVLTLDMPSVSQVNVNTTRLNRSNTKSVRRRRRSPYKLRARSLDIHIKKNEFSGRSKRHSLAGDTPVMENYHIEEAVTDEEFPIPVEKDAKIIIDLMEDEYLNTIEKEILQRDEKKNQSVTGWDRIKDFNKTMNRTMKRPKQLKIELQTCENKKEGRLDNSYDLEAMENYFIENMEKMLQSGNRGCEESPAKKSMRSALDAGKQFMSELSKLAESEKEKCLREFESVMSELKQMFAKCTSSKNVQTETSTVDAVVQTETNTFDGVAQTETSAVDAQVQTKPDESLYCCQNCANNNVTKSANTLNKMVQTEVDRVSVDVQTETLQDKRQSTTSSATPSDIFVFDEKEDQAIRAAFDVDFNTEEMRIEAEASKNEASSGDGRQSVLIVSSAESQQDGSKGVKRLQPESPVGDSGKFQSKRPCAKFINEDLSVGFVSCVEEQDGGKVGREAQFSEESDDINYDEYLTKLLKKYDKCSGESVEADPPLKTRSQEQIEQLENIIYNATKPTRSATEDARRPPKQEHPSRDREGNISSKPEDDLDYFKPYSSVVDAEKTPKKSRRSLFNADNQKEKFSESMFLSDRNATVIANKTITEDNVDEIMSGFDRTLESAVDKEVEAIFERETPKINILGNVLVKSAVNGCDANGVATSDDPFFSDTDVVESTPQKKLPSFSEHRAESMLDITLPPPIEFQDGEENAVPREVNSSRFQLSPRRPLAPVNKITSTPFSVREDSEKLSLSPIAFQGSARRSPLQDQRKISISTSTPVQPRGRVPGPLELAQRAKFSPLTIVKRPQSSCRLSGTPKQNSILKYVRSSQDSPDSQTSLNSSLSNGKPCIACSRVSRDQVMAISALTNRKLASYSATFGPKVTHLIVSANERNFLRDHTIKFVSAVAAGAWVLSFGWVQECLRRNCIVPEEPYEVMDVSGIAGPKQSRLTRTTKPLFKGYKIHAAPPFVSTSQKEIENVVRLLGGKVVRLPENLLDKEGYVCIIVTEAKASQDFEMYETWLDALKVVTVDIEWLSRSVGQYQILSLRPFVLCSEDYIERLGYPPQLLVNMTYSASQQTFSSVPSST